MPREPEAAQRAARIERWECPEHGADSGPGKRCGRMARPYVLCHRDKVKVEYVPASQLTEAVEALQSLRAAWNEHMKTCQQHVKVPSLEEIDAWMKAPSNTASGGQGGGCG